MQDLRELGSLRKEIGRLKQIVADDAGAADYPGGGIKKATKPRQPRAGCRRRMGLPCEGQYASSLIAGGTRRRFLHLAATDVRYGG